MIPIRKSCNFLDYGLTETIDRAMYLVWLLRVILGIKYLGDSDLEISWQAKILGRSDTAQKIVAVFAWSGLNNRCPPSSQAHKLLEPVCWHCLVRISSLDLCRKIIICQALRLAEMLPFDDGPWILINYFLHLPTCTWCLSQQKKWNYVDKGFCPSQSHSR